jgi:hypothetical protein
VNRQVHRRANPVHLVPNHQVRRRVNLVPVRVPRLRHLVRVPRLRLVSRLVHPVPARVHPVPLRLVNHRVLLANLLPVPHRVNLLPVRRLMNLLPVHRVVLANQAVLRPVRHPVINVVVRTKHIVSGRTR